VKALDRLFEPEWAGGWDLARWGFVVAAILAHLPRTHRIGDAYASPDMVFTTGPFVLADYVRWTVPTAWAIWAAGAAAIALVAWGGRCFRPGVALYLVASWALLAEEALDVKAHDRLFTWIALVMLLSPAGERRLSDKWRSPAARWAMIVIFAAIYGSTGFCKLLLEPRWLDGTAMQYHLVHRWHGGSPLAAWVASHWSLTAPLGWFTLLFECAFPILVWWRRANPWLLGAGVAFHLGTLALMNVGAFPIVSLAAYPALLHPEVARALHARIRALVVDAHGAGDAVPHGGIDAGGNATRP
jgi:hypothetical protein